MTDSEISQMLKEIVMEIDYDIYKSLFLFPDYESEEQKKVLIEIVRSHLNIGE